MNLDPGILCFDHCSSRIFCISLPDVCPLCRAELTSNTIPFRIPCPFKRAVQNPCSILVRPTEGSFLSEYEPNDDLHVGVTSSAGILFEFDQRGLTRGTPSDEWNQSLVVFGTGRAENVEFWDGALHLTAGSDQWTSEMYDEVQLNCFNFVIEFLKCTRMNIGIDLTAKRTFIENYVSQPILRTLKYVNLYRAIVRDGIFVHPKDPSKNSLYAL
ncbi:unnamed protein product [Nesidiocoris tenuis]|uniref:MKRN2 opposite strand protein n=1 Tax=Nesidiocoris tenuis TaxID=355587 RepID=A0A6H5H4V6_9HEMI|nr:unnamed protein product [Nesidiocoris tenuis]CAB0013302.1 unnamed protein product [Nesidiocoris tenuis]